MRARTMAGLGVLSAAGLAVLAVLGCSRERGNAVNGASAIADSGATRGATLLPDSGTLGTSPAGGTAATAAPANGSAESSGGGVRRDGAAPGSSTAPSAPSDSTGKGRLMRPPPPHDTSPRPVPRPQLPKPPGY